ncbi:4824_t:CDS:2 [Funneliformis geosporum]|nr:4824_t:CDS:2 [Funneliformis geosporum]
MNVSEQGRNGGGIDLKVSVRDVNFVIQYSMQKLKEEYNSFRSTRNGRGAN